MTRSRVLKVSEPGCLPGQPRRASAVIKPLPCRNPDSLKKNNSRKSGNNMLFEIPSSSSLSGAALAYLGDSVLELIARQYLLSTGVTDVGKLNSLALSYVKATAQSDAMENLLPVLTAEEAAVFRRGRNSHSIAIPKSAKAGQYRRATGMEALFAWLYINGRPDRMKELFTVGFIGENGEG